MKIPKIIALLVIVLFINSKSHAQTKKSDLFILADTINVVPENKFLEMGSEGPMHYFTYLCKCISPFDRYTTFTYNINKTKVVKSKHKPNFNFVSWKELAEILYNEGKGIPDKYNIFITEVLPDKSYRTDNVRLVLVPPPIIDFSIVKP